MMEYKMFQSNPFEKCIWKSLITTLSIVALVLSGTSTVGGEHLDLAYSCIHMNDFKAKEDLTPVILLHGLTDSRQTWFGLYQVLALETGRRICIADARNHGDSPWSDDVSVEAMVEDVEHLMDHLKIPKAVLVGHSMGGKIAMVMALKKPNRVDKIVIEDMRPNGIEPKALQLVVVYVKLLKDSLSAIPKGSNEDEARQAVLDYINKQQKMLGVKQPIPPESAKQFPLDCVNGTCRWKTNLKAIFNAMKNPKEFLKDIEGEFLGDALFIYGELSPFQIGKDKKNILELFPNAEFVGIKGAAHNIHNRFPEFMDAVVKFLKPSANKTS